MLALKFEVAKTYNHHSERVVASCHSPRSPPPGRANSPARTVGSGADPLRLADFADGGPGNTCLPGPGLAAALDALSGPDQRCPGADDDQLIGLLGRWQALEAWAAAAKLGVARELIRRRADHPCRHAAPGDLPHRWDHGTGHEFAAALALWPSRNGARSG
jgi:hypothetical protein